MTIDQVAAAAGVSKPTIYLRYQSKRNLVAAMIDRLRPPPISTATGSTTDDLIALIELLARCSTSADSASSPLSSSNKPITPN